MNSVLAATLAGSITAICWGSADWLVSRLSKKRDKFIINFAFQIPSSMIMLPILLMGDFTMPTLTQIGVIFIMSSLFTGAFLSFIKAFSTGSVGIVVPLGNTYSLITLVLSVAFLGTAITSPQIAAVLLIIVGAITLAYEKNTDKIPLRELHQTTFFALGAAVMWGVTFFFADTIVGVVPWQVITGYTSVFMTVMAFILAVYFSKGSTAVTLRKSLNLKIALAGGVIGQTGAMFLYAGSEKAGSVIIPAVIAASAPLVSSGLAAVYDHEKVGLIKRLGAVVVVAGIIILNLV